MNSVLSFECNAPDVVFEHFGDEVVLLNLKSGNYYSLTPCGMVCWELLSQGVPASEVESSVAGQYSGAPAAEDLQRFLSELISEELLRPVTVSRSVSEIALQSAWPKSYEAPQLSKFDDVADMLLLDPVHDVSDVGWPHPAPSNKGNSAGA